MLSWYPELKAFSCRHSGIQHSLDVAYVIFLRRIISGIQTLIKIFTAYLIQFEHIFCGHRVIYRHHIVMCQGFTMDKEKAIEFLVYTVAILVIIAISFYDSLFLLAPPYAVSAYLMIFENQSKFSKKSYVAVSYLFVILSSKIIHLALGISTYFMALNVVIVSLFISYSKFSHSPAIALTIFSYIVHNTIFFAFTSVVVLLAIILTSIASDFMKHWLELGQGE